MLIKLISYRKGEAKFTKEGLVPQNIPIQAGVPTTLEVDVQTDGLGCMSNITIPGLDNQIYGVTKGSTLVFNVNAPAGKHNITCSVGMLHGNLVASN